MWTKIWNVAEVFMSSLCLCVPSPHIYNCIDWRWGKLLTLTWPRCESWSKRINGCLLLYYVLRWLSNSVPFLLHISKDVFCPQCGRGVNSDTCSSSFPAGLLLVGDASGTKGENSHCFLSGWWKYPVIMRDPCCLLCTYRGPPWLPSNAFNSM